jgi:hypothetical protein
LPASTKQLLKDASATVYLMTDSLSEDFQLTENSLFLLQKTLAQQKESKAREARKLKWPRSGH